MAIFVSINIGIRRKGGHQKIKNTKDQISDPIIFFSGLPTQLCPFPLTINLKGKCDIPFRYNALRNSSTVDFALKTRSSFTSARACRFLTLSTRLRSYGVLLHGQWLAESAFSRVDELSPSQGYDAMEPFYMAGCGLVWITTMVQMNDAVLYRKLLKGLSIALWVIPFPLGMRMIGGPVYCEVIKLMFFCGMDRWSPSEVCRVSTSSGTRKY